MLLSNSSPFSGLVRVIIVLVLIGALAALALTGSDLTNFMANRAKAQAMSQQNEIEAEKAKIDLQNYQTLQAIQVQAQIDKAQADSAAYQRSLEQQMLYEKQLAEQSLQMEGQKATQAMENARIIKIALGIGAAVLAFLVGLGVCIYFILLGRSRLIAVKANARVDPWKDLVWRKQMVAISRERSRARAGSITSQSPIPVEIPVGWQELQERILRGQTQLDRKEK